MIDEDNFDRTFKIVSIKFHCKTFSDPKRAIEYLNWIKLEYNTLSLNDRISWGFANEGISDFNEAIDNIIRYYRTMIKPERLEGYAYDDKIKLNWLGTKTDFAYLISVLISKGYINKSYKNILSHFQVNGEDVTSKQLIDLISKLKNPDTDNRPSLTIEEFTNKLSNSRHKTDKK